VGIEGYVVQTQGPHKRVSDDRFLRHGCNAEMDWGTVVPGEYLTPIDSFFVRSQSTTPVIDPRSWRLEITGASASGPIELDYDTLLSLPAITYVRALECAGNGRRFFTPAHGREPVGNQWGFGAIGVARWTGVRLSDVLSFAGVDQTAGYVTAEGLDAERVSRPLPMCKAREDDTLIAYGMNGEPLPVDHGRPARLVVSGWAAIASIKWLGRIRISREPVWTKWNTEVYVLTGRSYPRLDGRPQPVEEQVVKSALELDWDAELGAGFQTVTGRAWSPHGTVAAVEYSIDGSSWRPAVMVEPNLERAWARFRFGWDAAPGRHRIRVRAADDHGNVQPERVAWNDHGYIYGGIIEHPVRVVASGAGRPGP
jgi:sulfane dehydrogenase subunit SoxC